MEKCHYCDNEAVGICSRCQNHGCKDHLTLLPNEERTDMFIIKGKTPFNFAAICNDCRKKEQRKKMTVAITIVIIVSIIGIAILTMRLAGFWFW